MDPTLISKQEAGAEVERRMIAFLMQFIPAEELKLADIKQIASQARRAAFDCFLEVR